MLVPEKLVHGFERAALARHRRTHRRWRLGVVFVAWDQERSRRVERALYERLASRSWLDARVIAVANRDGLKLESETLHGTNQDGEFSGYDEGLAFLKRGGSVDAWLLVNDRLLDYPLNPLRFLNAGVLTLLGSQHVVVGPLDQLPSESTLLGWRVGVYCRSNYVLASSEALMMLGQITTVGQDQIEAWRGAAGSSRQPLRQVEGIGLAYADFLTGWLTGTRDPHWYRAQALTEDQGWFWEKLKSILNEHLLGARLQAQGELLLSPLHAGLLGRLSEPGPAIAQIKREPKDALDFYRNRTARLRLAATALID